MVADVRQVRLGRAMEFARAHPARTWWAVVLAAVVGLGLMYLYVSISTPRPSVHQVVGDGPNLWARTWEPFWLDGDTAWQVSHDGGLTWSDASPPSHVEDADPVTEVCSQTACYRLVDGVRIERQASAEGTWELTHERDAEPIEPGPYHWSSEQTASIAATTRPGNEIIVAAGSDGVLVLTESGTWSSETVGTSIFVRSMRWLLVPLTAVILLIGAAGHLIIRAWTKRRPRTPPDTTPDSPPGNESAVRPSS